ncbi:MAG: crossover junction endodeoxyribonuclease RuvC [Oligoflexales bacterium]
MRILGIDPGSKVTGFAILSSDKTVRLQPSDFTVLDAGALKPHPSISVFEKMTSLHQAVGDLIAEWKPDVCVIEKAFVGINVSSALRLGEVRGAIIAAFGSRKTKIVEVAPKTVKRVITGNGNATKEDVLQCIKLLMKVEIGNLPFDVSDALAIALYYGLYHVYDAKVCSSLEKQSERQL